MASFYLRNYYG
jgi:hypothetical protein